jgi:hypothetical protein
VRTALLRWLLATPVRLNRLPERFRWTPHNLVAHPLSEMLFQFGHEAAGNLLHDATVPAHAPGTGRG